MAPNYVKLVDVQEAVHEQRGNNPHTLAPQEQVLGSALRTGLSTLQEQNKLMGEEGEEKR